MRRALANWAANVVFSAQHVHAPTSVDEVRDLVARSDRIRAIGTGHSFNRIADSTGELVSLARLPDITEVDAARSTVTVGGGVRYGELAVALHAAGFALANLGSLPHISVAGACATGTHGSGDANRSLASAVRSLEMVTADGDLVTLSRDDAGDEFCGAVVALGSLGIVTQLTLDLVPAFDVRQFVYDDLPVAALVENFDEIARSAYSVSVFTDWRSRTNKQVWLKQRGNGSVVPPARWKGATLATDARHPLPGMPVVNCTEQIGVVGPWHERLPHFRLEFRPSNGNELQTEYLLPRRHAADAIQAVRAIGERVSSLLQVSEIRTVAADDLWLSPAFGRDTVAFHFTWVKDEGAVLELLPVLENQLAPFEARPHWGKLFTMSAEVVQSRYPRFADFERLMQRYDARGKFRNAFVDRYFRAGSC